MGSLGEIMKLCRLCLVKDQVNVPIFEGAGDIRKISQKIGACLPVKVTKDDKLPKKICNGCSHKLDMVYQFWNTTTSSEKQLLEWVNNPSSRPLEERGVVAEHIVLKQEVDNGDSEALDAGEFIDVNETFETIGFAHDDDDEMSNENIDIKTENDSRCDEPPIKKHKTVSLSSAESEEDADDPSDAYNRDDSDEDDNDVSEAQPAFVNVAEADQQPGPSGVGKASGEAPDEELIKIDTTMGPKFVQKKYVEFQTSREKQVTIKTKDGKTIPLLVKPLAITFRKDIKVTSDEDQEAKRRRCSKTNKNFIMCEKCGKRYPNEEKLNAHYENYHVEVLSCQKCDKTFDSEIALRKHRYSHNMVTYQCDVCHVTINSKKAYMIHVRRHNGDYSHKCEECGKEYYNTLSFTHHMEAEHAGIRYPCNICGSVLKSKRYYKEHMANHEEKVAIQFQCEVCKKYYSTKSGLVAHMRAHKDSRYVCDVCGKQSIQKGAHDAHMRSHTGEKTYMCDLCGKGFIRKDVLDKHMAKIHETFKQACVKCGEFFLTDYELLLHMHTHDDIEKPFPCNFCDERFLDKNILRNHVNRVHVENKPDKLAKTKVKKEIHGKSRKSTLPGKLRSLFNKNEFCCRLCTSDNKFDDLSKLKAHLLKHSDGNDGNFDEDDDDDEDETYYDQEPKDESTDEVSECGLKIEVEVGEVQETSRVPKTEIFEKETPASEIMLDDVDKDK